MPIVYANIDAGSTMLYQARCDHCGGLGEPCVYAETVAWRARLDGWDLDGYDHAGERLREDAVMLCPSCSGGERTAGGGDET